MTEYESKDIEDITRKILSSADAHSEMELQIKVEHILRNFFESQGIGYEPRHNITVINGRPDTLYGHAIIEYKVPGTLNSKAKLKAAVVEAQRNISESATQNKEDPVKYIGIILDGYKITFTKFRKKWLVEPLSDISTDSVLRMLMYLRGLAKKPLHPDYMVGDFGPNSNVAKLSISLLYRMLVKTKVPRVKVLYQEWDKTFNQVCGYDFTSAKTDVKELVEVYELNKTVNEIELEQIDLSKLLFCIHTYYALVIKFLAAEITITYASPLTRSFLDMLSTLNSSMLKLKLDELEEGGIFAEMDIKNFLEGDFFGWYLDIWNEEIKQMVMQVVNKLLEYEPSTAALEPDEVRDLLKKLYQYLVPKKVRHDLGEYFTPDWLAEIALNEVRFDGNVQKRVLDPSCGSGTFLVLAIKRAKEYAQDNLIDKSATLAKILENIVGFDLNPLAVIASRTNYLIALGELLRYRKGEIHIPVYLSDSISVSGMQTLEGKIYHVSTSVGKFKVPADVIDEKIIDSIFTIMDACIRDHYQAREFIDRIKGNFQISDSSLQMLEKLYANLLELELKSINRIWARVIKNSFAPFFSGKFDYIIGNPPWVNWENLPEDYRDASKSLWLEYELIKGMGVGKFKKDIAMLFVAVSVNRYLSENGSLAFLVPFTLVKTQAGSGYRNFLAYKSQVIKIHEMVELAPFENAVNRTSLLILKQGKTKFPINCTSWSKKENGELGYNLSLDDIKQKTIQYKMILEPIEARSKPESPWLLIDHALVDSFRKICGTSDYYAYSGVDTGLNSSFWIDLLSETPTGMLIRNLSDVGKIELREVETIIEKDAIFPLARGRDVTRWFGKPSIHIALLHNSDGQPFSDNEVKKNYHRTYTYFLKFKEQLEKRSTHRLMGKGKPFYSAYKIGAYTFSPYKVVWKHVAGKISGIGEFSSAVLTPVNDKQLGKRPVIPDHSLMLIPFEKENEANFVSAVLNSSPASLIIAGYTIETEIPTNIPQYVRIPTFNSSDSLHKAIVELSKKARQYAENDDQKGLQTIQLKIDQLVAKIYGLNKREIIAIRKSLQIIHE